MGDRVTTGQNYGPLISQEHRDKVLSLRQGDRGGATLVTGGGVPDMPGELAAGAWVQPTIWTDLPESAAVVREEIFGPCCHIRPFDSEEELLPLVNANRYSLSTTVKSQTCCKSKTGCILRFERLAAFGSNNQRSIPWAREYPRRR